MARASVHMAVLMSGAMLAAVPAHGEDLRSALVMAYNTNPTLQAARAQQRALDETPGIARADGLPSVSANGSLTEVLRDNPAGNSIPSSGGFGPDRVLSGSANLGVPIYSGGGVRNSVRAAETRVQAGQADLRGTESEVFSQAVGAYMDVILAEAVVGLNRKNVEVLSVNLRATTDRFEIGDVTRTDVAQSQARLALARGDTRSAEANLSAARERYIQVIGAPPGTLDTPPPLPGLPDAAEAAVATALDNNPDIFAANQRSKAAAFDVKTAGAGRLPRVSVFAAGTYTDYLNTLGGPGSGTFLQHGTGATAGVQATIPIFQGGRPAALRRQAQARESAALETGIAVERSVIAQTRAAYSSWLAANEIIISTQSAVDAAALSLEGVRAENSVGNRTILDILDAEQELLQARVRLATAQRNAYVAGFTLLAAMGKAEAEDLGLDGGALYDPQANYKRVHGKLFDWDNDPAPVPQATRTVDTPTQSGSIPTE